VLRVKPPPGGVGVGNIGPSANAWTEAREAMANITRRSLWIVEIIGKNSFSRWNL
jgi:hypothetical protein